MADGTAVQEREARVESAVKSHSGFTGWLKRFAGDLRKRRFVPPETPPISGPPQEQALFQEEDHRRFEQIRALTWKVLRNEDQATQIHPDKPTNDKIIVELFQEKPLLNKALRDKRHLVPTLDLMTRMIGPSKVATSPHFRLAALFIEENLNYLNSILEKGEIDNHQITVVMDAVSRLLISGHASSPDDLMRFLISNLSQSINSADNKSSNAQPFRDPTDYSNIISRMLGYSYYNEKQHTEICAVMTNNFSYKNRVVPLVLSELYQSKNPQIKERTLSIIKVLLEGIGLGDADTLLNHWKDNPVAKEGVVVFEQTVGENIKAIAELERRIPKACAFLWREFGIKMFARYPTELLARQYDEREDTTKPTGVILNPLYDRNGAYYNSNLYFGLSDKLAGKYNIRVIESGNPKDALRLLAQLRRKYGKNSFGVVGGHGINYCIRLGPGDNDILYIHDLAENFQKINVLESQDPLTGQHKQVIRNASPQSVFRYLFEEDAPIALLSCFAGQAGSLGQEASRLGVRIITQETSTEAYSILPVLNANGKIENLDVRYRDRGVRREYAKGKLL